MLKALWGWARLTRENIYIELLYLRTKMIMPLREKQDPTTQDHVHMPLNIPVNKSWSSQKWPHRLQSLVSCTWNKNGSNCSIIRVIKPSTHAFLITTWYHIRRSLTSSSVPFTAVHMTLTTLTNLTYQTWMACSLYFIVHTLHTWRSQCTHQLLSSVGLTPQLQIFWVWFRDQLQIFQE